MASNSNKNNFRKKKWRGIRVRKKSENLLTFFLLFSDAFLMNLIFYLVFFIWFRGYDTYDLYLQSYLDVRSYLYALYLFFGVIFGLFSIRNFKTVSEVFFYSSNTLLASFVSFNLFAFLSRQIATISYTFPRPVFLIATIINIFIIFFMRAFLRSLFIPDPLLKKTVIIGNRQEGRRIIRHFHCRGGVRFKIVKFLESAQLEQLASEVIFHCADEVLVTDTNIDLDKFWASIFYQRNQPPHDFKVRVSLDPRKTAANLSLLSLEDFPLITISSFPFSQFQRFLKRLFDIVFSIFAIIITSPVMVLTAGLVKYDSQGPFFYTQKRVGIFGRDFNLSKFRSMKVGSESGTGPTISTEDDPRISRIGRFIRRFGLDELPQFFLVLIGEMSVVGPRPERPYFVKEYSEFQGRRLSIKPGLTGLAAVNSRYYLNITDKVAYDYYYLDNYSFILDIKIILQTIWVLLLESPQPNRSLQPSHDTEESFAEQLKPKEEEKK